MFKITDSAKEIVLAALKENKKDCLKVIVIKHGDHSHIDFDLIDKGEGENVFDVNGINVDCKDEDLKVISHLILDSDEEGLVLHSTEHHCCGHHHEHEGSCCEGEEHDDGCGCGCGCHHEGD